MKILDAVPVSARHLYANGWFFDGSESLREAATRLVTHEQMQSCWKTLAKACDPTFVDELEQDWAASYLYFAVDAFSYAIEVKSGWANLTAVKQEKWVRSLNQTVEKLQTLIEDGPLPDRETEIAHFLGPLASPESKLMNFARCKNEESPDQFKSRVLRLTKLTQSRPESLREILNVPRYSFCQTLERYVSAQLKAAESNSQTLKKPGDLKAGRATFLQDLTQWCYAVSDKPLCKVVADTAAVLFDDSRITDRLVRTHTILIRQDF